MTTCIICRVDASSGMVFCPPCAKAFDRWNKTSSGDSQSLIKWVADRVWRLARARAEVEREENSR